MSDERQSNQRLQAFQLVVKTLAGTGTLAWELAAQHGGQLWVWIIILYLFGAPFEDLVRLLTSGRILIERKGDDDEDREDKRS